MRRYMTAIAVAAISLAATAQSLTIFKTTGERIGFNSDRIEKIEFSPLSIGEASELKVINFYEKVEDVSPAEGIVDIATTPLGLGRITITMNGIYEVNHDSNEEIVLANTKEIVFSRRPDAEGMYTYRNSLTGKTEFSYVFNPDGFTDAGIYHLYIPKGAYVDSYGNLLSGCSRVFIIQTPPQSQEITATPAEGVVTSLSTVSFKYNNYSVVEVLPTAKAYVTKEGGKLPEAMTVPTAAADGTVTVTFPQITTPGIYTVLIPAGSFALREEAGGKALENDEISLVYQIEGAQQAPPKVGDFYYSDGSWSTTLVKREGVKPIGVIFYLGEAKEGRDNASFYTLKDGKTPMTDFHGYVVAFRDATETPEGNVNVAWHKFDGNDVGTGCSTNTSDHLGYTNTQSAIAYAEKNYGGLSDSNESLPAVYYATTYFESQVPAPAKSSGWFLPSAGQLKYIFDRVYFEPNTGMDAAYLEKSFKALADFGGKEMYVRDSKYWTSTEYIDAYGKSFRAHYADFDSSNIKNGGTPWFNKNGEFHVRSILAF